MLPETARATRFGTFSEAMGDRHESPGARRASPDRRRTSVPAALRRVGTLAALLFLAAAPAAPAAASDLERGKEVSSELCIACHGADGNSPAPAFPKLAGLQAEYIAKQMYEYLDGKRTNEMMAPVLEQLKPADIEPLAAWFASQKAAPGKVVDSKLAEAGQKLFVDGNPDSGVPACMGCHLENGLGNPRYPRIAGQYQEYTLQQMLQFKSGARSNDRGRVMRTIASRMTEEEMKAVAEYIAGL